MECTGLALAEKVALIPILRSGLGMSEAMLELLPNAGVHHIGMYRGKDMLPIQYYNRLPKTCIYDVAFILDPVISTSNTVSSVVGILSKWGVKKIHVISVLASQSGLENLLAKHPYIHITLGAVDNELTKDGLIFPGVGDTGDRLFGTFFDDGEDEALLHPSKRRKMSEADLSVLK
jgi:uracil phosphoribosyltransferase